MSWLGTGTVPIRCLTSNDDCGLAALLSLPATGLAAGLAMARRAQMPPPQRVA